LNKICINALFLREIKINSAMTKTNSMILNDNSKN